MKNSTRFVINKVIIALITFVLFALQLQATTITSSSTGTWSSASTWIGGVVPGASDTVVIAAGTNVTVGATTTVKQLTVNSDAYLTVLTGKTLTVTGGILNVNGMINGAGAVTYSTSGGYFTGKGSVENTGTFRIAQNTSIPDTATLIKSGSAITILADKVLTNNGSITVYGSITGASATAQFVNASNAYVSVGTTLMNTGLLDASANNNTVDYSSTGTQTIKATTYYHLSLSGAGSKRIGAAIDINGDFTATAPFNTQGNNVNIAGNYTHSNSFTYSTSTVTFDGTSDQTLSATVSGAQSFYNFVVNKPSGTLIVLSNIIARNALTLTSGNVNNASFKLTLGTSTSNIGTLNYTSGTIIGSFERWLATSTTGTPILFPVGTATDYRPATLTFSTISTGGRLSYLFNATPPSNTGLPVVDGAVTLYNNFNDGQWTATGTSLVSSNYTVELNASGFSAFTIDANSRILTSASGTFAASGSHVSQVGTLLTRAGISGVTASFAIASNINCTLPTLPTITGTTTPCKNTTVAYSVPNNIGSTYTWTLPSGTSISGASNTNSVNIDFDATTGTKTISVKETNACGQGPSASLSLNVGPVQPVKINGYSKVAEGDEGVVFYVDSIAGYTYTWSVSNGTIVSGQSKGRVAVNFPTQGTATLNVIAVGCSTFAPTTSKTVNVSKVLVSTDTTGNIGDPAVWQGAVVTSTANIKIDSAAVITVPVGSTVTSVNSLTIAEGGTLILDRNFTVSGNLVIDGILNTNGFTLTLSGIDKTIRGTGTIAGTGIISITGGNKTITSDANLTIPGSVSIDASSITVTNNGTVTIQTDLTRSSSSSTRVWTNAAGSSLTVNGNSNLNTLNTGTSSTLIVGGNLSSTTITGASSTTTVSGTTGTITAGSDATLNLVGDVTSYTAGVNSTLNLSGTPTTIVATATGNTVNYIGSSQSVKGTTYHNLNISGTGTALFSGNVTVNGDLNINNTVALDAATRSVALKGNFIVTSSAATPFVAGTSTLTFSGTSTQLISSPVALTFYKVVVNKASGNVQLNKNLNVTNTLTLTLGDIDLNGNVLDLSTTGSLVNEKETSRIKGNGSVSASKTITAGLNNQNIGNLGALLSNTNDLGLVSVIRSHTAFGSGTNQTPTRSYDVTPTNNTGLSTTLRLYFLAAELSATGEVPSKLYRSTDGGSTFSAPTGTPTTGSNYVQLTGISSFSKWVPGGSTPPSSALPVVLSHFSASRELNIIPISWTTTMEIDNKEFVIERSFDGTNFEAIATIPGVGNTSSATNYSYNVLNAPEHSVFFRLKQVDFDGDVAYSKIIGVAAASEAISNYVDEPSFSVFPNPVTANEMYLAYNNVEKQTVVVQIYDASEKVHYTEEIDVEGDGITKLYLVPSQTLARGLYYLTIKTDSKIHTIKLVVE